MFRMHLTNKEILEKLLSFSEELRQHYELYQLLLFHFQEKNSDHFFDLIEQEIAIVNPIFQTVLKTFLKDKDKVVNAMDLPYSNAKLEATNNLIKVIKRNAFGFRNFENFKKRVRIEVKIIPKRDLLHFIQNPFNLFPNLTNNGYIGELNQERISNLYIWMENTFNSLRGNQDGDYRFNNLNVKLQRGRLYLSLLNPNEVDGKGPKIVYTSEEVKSECPLNITIAKRPYLEKLSIFSSNLN